MEIPMEAVQRMTKDGRIDAFERPKTPDLRMVSMKTAVIGDLTQEMTHPSKDSRRSYIRTVIDASRNKSTPSAFVRTSAELRGMMMMVRAMYQSGAVGNDIVRLMTSMSGSVEVPFDELHHVLLLAIEYLNEIDKPSMEDNAIYSKSGGWR